jgi:N-acetylglutamate synthase-like GNAT family acetyltransferase
MSVTLREARPEDLAVIEVVAAREELDNRRARAEEYVVAEADGVLIGFGRLLDHPEAWEIACLYVEPGRRRRRIGTRIVQALLDRTSAEKPIYAVAGAPEFFTALGFVPTEDMPASIRAKLTYCQRHFAGRVIVMRLEEGRRP